MGNHPLEFLNPVVRRRLFIVFTGLALVCYLVFMLLDQPLRTNSAPAGIVSFEMAAGKEKALSIINSWNAEAKLNVAFGLGFDFIFMPAYAMSLSLGILMVSTSWNESWRKIGNRIGWAPIVAAGFDTVENIALYIFLAGNFSAVFPILAAASATIKFGLLILGAVYGLFGLLFLKKAQ